MLVGEGSFCRTPVTEIADSGRHGRFAATFFFFELRNMPRPFFFKFSSEHFSTKLCGHMPFGETYRWIIVAKNCAYVCVHPRVPINRIIKKKRSAHCQSSVHPTVSDDAHFCFSTSIGLLLLPSLYLYTYTIYIYTYIVCRSSRQLPFLICITNIVSCPRPLPNMLPTCSFFVCLGCM